MSNSSSSPSPSPSPNPLLLPPVPPPPPPTQHSHLSVAVGVAITALAGAAVAAAIYNRRSPLNKRRRRRSLLTPKQWQVAFECESGRLLNPHKILKKIRFGGVDPSIRAEVWLFLLGFYELDSTQKEREAEKTRKREVYMDLKIQCNALRENMLEASSEDSSSSFVQPEKICSIKNKVLERDDIVFTEEDSSEEIFGGDDCREEDSSLLSSKIPTTQMVDKVENVDPKGGKWISAPEDFMTWQRIIRLDAVRMNAEWIPYSPSQANVTHKIAWELASNVGLKDDEHLEPCRQHHAARLVSILEAYALFDPEIGYCQGMSDLLSPFVALLDDDCEAFWCFVQFMNSARHNYRRDEVGIRRQLGKISNIFKVGDQGLHSHFERTQAQDCFFVYRMVVVLLRRELTFEQTISLWEVIWAEKKAVALGQTKSSSWKIRRKQVLTDDLILYVIVAAVRQRRKVILEKCKGLDEILRECHNMAGHLDVWTLLDDARELLSVIHGRVSD